MGLNIDRVQSTNPVRPTMRNDVAEQENKHLKQATTGTENGNVTEKNLKQAVEEFEKGIEKLKEIQMGDLKIEYDKEADMKVVRIVDKNTGEVLKEIPPKEIVELAKSLNEMLGILFDKMA